MKVKEVISKLQAFLDEDKKTDYLNKYIFKVME
jgi:hypothetical protein